MKPIEVAVLNSPALLNIAARLAPIPKDAHELVSFHPRDEGVQVVVFADHNGSILHVIEEANSTGFGTVRTEERDLATLWFNRIFGAI